MFSPEPGSPSQLHGAMVNLTMLDCMESSNGSWLIRKNCGEVDAATFPELVLDLFLTPDGNEIFLTSLHSEMHTWFGLVVCSSMVCGSVNGG